MKVKAGGQRPITWLADYVGFYIMAFGGSCTVAFLLNSPIPLLLSPFPLLLYTAVHTCVSITLWLFPFLLSVVKLFEFPLAGVDALTRSLSIIGAVTNTKASTLQDSLFAQVILGAISVSAGGQIAGTLNVWQRYWSLTTPPLLQSPGILNTLDIWSACLAVLIYGACTPVHSAYQPYFQFFANATSQKAALLTPAGARSLVVLFLALCYWLRLVIRHLEWSLESLQFLLSRAIRRLEGKTAVHEVQLRDRKER